MGAVKDVSPISLELSHREVLEASATAYPKSPSPTLYMVAVVLWFMAAMETGLALAFMLSQRLEPPMMVLVHHVASLAIPALLFLVGLVSINIVYNRLVASRYERDRIIRKVPESVPATYTVDAEGLHLTTPRGDWLTRWGAVSSLRSAAEGWLAVCDLGNLYIPRRGFADARHERTFVEGVLEHLNDDGRQASTAARDWLATN